MEHTSQKFGTPLALLEYIGLVDMTPEKVLGQPIQIAFDCFGACEMHVYATITSIKVCAHTCEIIIDHSCTDISSLVWNHKEFHFETSILRDINSRNKTSEFEVVKVRLLNHCWP